jgi:hypothetical protein
MVSRMGSTSSPDGGNDDHRKAQRHRTLKGGLIVFNDGRSTIECMVRNLSEGGAQLTVASVIGIPQTFVLKLNEGGRTQATIAWKRGNTIGVKFDAPPVP